MSVSGVSAYAQYGKQSNFTTALSLGACTRAFGMNQQPTGPHINENLFLHGDLNTVLVQKGSYGKCQGDFSVKCDLSNPWFNDLVLGNAVTTGSGPYTHTYDDSKTVNAITAEIGVDTTTNRVVRCQRATIRDITITAEQNAPVAANMGFDFWATPAAAETTIDSSVVVDDILTPYTFEAGAIFEYPSGTPVGEVQGFELTMNPNIKPVPEPNNQFAVNAYKGRLDLTGKFNVSVRDNTWWDNVRARAELASTMRMKFTNGLSGTNERTLQYTFTGVMLSELTMAIPQQELVTDELPLTFRDVTAVAVNNTSTPP